MDAIERPGAAAVPGAFFEESAFVRTLVPYSRDRIDNWTDLRPAQC